MIKKMPDNTYYFTNNENTCKHDIPNGLIHVAVRK